MKFRDKLDMFFLDYNITPLLVQESYLSSMENNFTESIDDVKRMANAANSLSLGDTFDNRMRKDNNWSLLPDIGISMAVAPSHYCQGSLRFTRFPEWFGKNSTKTKAKRLMNELMQSLGHRAQCSRKTLLIDYVPIIFDEVFNQLKNDNIEDAIDILDGLNISGEQFKEHIVTLLYDKNNRRVQKFENMSKESKASFTRTYNAAHKSSLVQTKKKRAVGNIENDLFNPEIEEEQAKLSDSESSEKNEVDVVQVKQTKKKGKAEQNKKADAKPKSTKSKTSKKK